MTPTNADLRQFILKTFSDEELETLCFDYFPEVMAEFGGGMSQNRKAILLIGHCERRGRMDDLRAALARERAEAWQDAFAPLVETFRRNVSTPILTRDPRQIFLSHATTDAAFAHRLAGDLRAEGWRVWIAPESIRAGEKWVEAIDRGLEESGVFVVVLTPNAVASRWVRTETNAAISMEHRDLIRFLPLDVAECRPPWTWTQYQYVSFRDSYEAGLGDLLAQLDEGQTAPTDVSPPVSSAPPPSRSPAPRSEKHVKEEQWRQLQALAHDIATELGRQSGQDELRAVYRRFNRQFGLTTYKKLPRRRFGEGLAFLTEWRDQIARSTQRGPGPDAAVETFRRNVSTPAMTSAPLPAGSAARRPFRLEDLVSRTGERSLSNIAVHEKTGIQFVRIPAGPFLFGDNKETVELPEYWIGRYPVTNAQYKRFVDATGHRAPRYWKDNAPPPDKLNHPVVNINWHDAQALAKWAGLRLPTEQEWEKAARGTDGRRYPWGGEEPTAERCNFNENVGDTTPVGQYSPKGDSPYGCADMAGNVWEWTASPYDVGQSMRVLKGGAYYTTVVSSLHGAYRHGSAPVVDGRDFGARLAVSPSS